MPPWDCRGFRPSCAKTAARSRPRRRSGFRSWWKSTSCGAICMSTRKPPTTAILSRMALGAKKRGFEYLAITDHSQHLGVAKGLDVTRLLAHLGQIDKLNDEPDGITLLKGLEVDILEGGSLDMPDDVLGKLDLVVGAVHDYFQLSQQKQTERILMAMDHPSRCWRIRRE